MTDSGAATIHFPDVERVFCRSGMTLRQTMEVIDRGSAGIALLVDQDGRLLATVSDGDVRRAILAGHGLESPVERLPTLPAFDGAAPLTAPQGTPVADLLRLMSERGVRQVPLLDNGGRVVDLALLWALHDDAELPIEAVVMAGGFGTRLRPFTETVPKPMLPVGGQPLMELTINHLRQAGIRKVNVTTHYLANVITDHFGDGADFGVRLNYVQEDTPLGTAGALSLLEGGDDPLLIINGDIVTDLDYRAMLDFHRQHGAMLTVAIFPYEFQIPYGVIDHQGADITGIREKPSLRHFVNAGIYLVEPQVRTHIPTNTAFSMTDLIALLLERGDRVVGFPIHEYWVDIGQHTDYQRVQQDLEEGRVRLAGAPPSIKE